MARKRQLVLMKVDEGSADGTGAGTLGRPNEFLEMLAPYNTAPDGSTRGPVGTEVLHGPGIVVEYATGQPEVRQALVNVLDEDVAWPVLSRICRGNGWKMMDTESGQVFG